MTLGLLLLLFAQAGPLPDSCLCPDGIGASAGDEPIARAAVGSTSLAVCGHLESEAGAGLRASEFDVVRCDTKISLLRLGARKTALIQAQPGGLLVTEVVQLPAGPGGAWIDVPVKRHAFVASGRDPVRVRTTVILKKIDLSRGTVKQTLADAADAIRRRSVDDDLVARLLVAALSGSAEARRRFRALPHELPLEGAVAETYLEARTLLDLTLTPR